MCICLHNPAYTCKQRATAGTRRAPFVSYTYGPGSPDWPKNWPGGGNIPPELSRTATWRPTLHGGGVVAVTIDTEPDVTVPTRTGPEW